MKVRTRIVLKTLLSATLVVGFWQASKFCNAMLAASYYTFTFDPLLSDIQQEKIIFAVRHTGITQIDELAHLIKEKCPAVNNVVIQRMANKSWHIEVTASSPFMIVNADWVLNQQGNLVSHSLYTSQSLVHIPSITMKVSKNTAPSLSPIFRQWLAGLDAAILKNYTIHWHGDYEIWLREKKNPTYALICTCLKALHPELIAYCEGIQKGTEGKANKTATKKPVVADVRFEKQIVLSAAKGEGVLNG